jgi:hypothetical protein
MIADYQGAFSARCWTSVDFGIGGRNLKLEIFRTEIIRSDLELMVSLTMSVEKRKRDADDVGGPGGGARRISVAGHAESSDIRLSIEKGEEHTRMRAIIPRPATVTDEDSTERQAIIPSAPSANRSSTQQSSTSLSSSSTPGTKSSNTSHQSSPTSDDVEMKRDSAKQNSNNESETLRYKLKIWRGGEKPHLINPRENSLICGRVGFISSHI